MKGQDPSQTIPRLLSAPLNKNIDRDVEGRMNKKEKEEREGARGCFQNKEKETILTFCLVQERQLSKHSYK